MTSCMRSLFAVLPLALVMSVTGCVRSQQAKESAAKTTNLSPQEQKSFDEYMAEVEIGRNMAGRLLGYYGVIDDEKLVGYVNQIGNYVASYSDYPDRRYMFAILKHESVNAFACPGGYVLITLGALRNAVNEAELGAILGHEVAHVGKRHMYDTLKKMKDEELVKAAESRKTREKTDPVLKGRERPEPAETGAGAMLARYLSGSSGASLNILAAAQAGMSLITERGLDKRLEFEADQEGVKYAIRAGYHPKALGIYLKRLKEKSEQNAAMKKKMKNIGKTHPSFDERMTRIADLLKTLKAEDIIGATGNERFDRVHKTLPKPDEA